MKEQATIEQMNEAIATFEGRKQTSLNEAGKVTKYWSDAQSINPFYSENVHYHESWEWLMPVVEKIATVCPDDVVHMEFGKTYTRCNLWNLDNGRTHVFDEYKATPILTVYHAVYQFIQWYNSNKS